MALLTASEILTFTIKGAVPVTYTITFTYPINTNTVLTALSLKENGGTVKLYGDTSAITWIDIPDYATELSATP